MRHHHLTQATPILDHHAPAIRQLIQQRNWTSLGLHDRVGAAYAFVRDEIAFGYNTQDDLPASRVLADGIAQRNGINHDFGLFDTPDDFYTRHGTNLSGFKRYLFQHVVRHWMNKTVQSIRSGK